MRSGKIRTEKFGAQVDEALALLVAYNLRVLVREVRVKNLDLHLRIDRAALEDCVRKLVGWRSPHLSRRAA